MLKTILRSTEDRSINIVEPTDDGGAIEARFVQRTDDTIIVYLSSATGCDRACRFCHLTQTHQTMMDHVDVKGYWNQAQSILDLARAEGKLEGVKIVHFNFMARGDALLNPHFVLSTSDVILGLARLAARFRLEPKFKISTIFPSSDIFGINTVFLKPWVEETLALHPEIEFYYSLYSLDMKFRKRWIPKAMDPNDIGDCFTGTVGKLRLHHALIEGENTSFYGIARIGQWLSDFNIHTRFNVVRYNPFSEASGKEPCEAFIETYRQIVEKLSNVMSSHIISRVGTDVKASCGTFVS